MSKKTKLQADMIDASRRAGGSHLSKQARAGFARLFVALIYSLGYPLMSIDEIGVRVIEVFVRARKEAGRKLRTLQNDLSTLRTILRHAGRRQFAQAPIISNRSLGIAGGSRRGTKYALTQEEFEALLNRVADPGLRAILCLERWIGLRATEAIRSIPSLATWRRVLQDGKPDLHVIFGTKNGKPRWTHVFNRTATLDAVEQALTVSATRRYLAPKGNLKEALQWYRNAMHRLGIQGHALRYRFAQDTRAAYVAAGYSRREAQALVSIDLGHGDSRGRWANSVYCPENLVPSQAASTNEESASRSQTKTLSREITTNTGSQR